MEYDNYLKKLAVIDPTIADREYYKNELYKKHKDEIEEGIKALKQMHYEKLVISAHDLQRFGVTMKDDDIHLSDSDEDEDEKNENLNWEELHKTSELTTYMRNIHRFAPAPPLLKFPMKRAQVILWKLNFNEYFSISYSDRVKENGFPSKIVCESC